MFRNLLIGIALFGLGWGASFAAGAAWGRRSVTPPAQAAVIPASQFAPGAQGQLGTPGQPGPGPGGAPAGAAGQGRGTAGTVERVEGQTLVVSGQNGQQVKVTLTDQTQISRQVAGTVADVAPGIRVLVTAQGQPAADGALTAATVSIIPEGAAGAVPAGAAPAGGAPGQPARQGAGTARPGRGNG